jgi:hypothetical protein
LLNAQVSRGETTGLATNAAKSRMKFLLFMTHS